MEIKGVCVRCKKEIFSKDDYLKLMEFLSGELKREEFYHKRCFDEFLKPKKLAMGMVAKTMNLLNKAEERLA